MMIAVGLTALFALAAIAALGTLGLSIAAALPRIAGIKAALADCPQTRELRFTIREITVSPRHGQVASLPVRIKPLALPQPLRAAA
ncbi:MAG: hypothetical protein QFC78_05645 [Pseudomonadota bacterium]|nr:hypothetical protein [Pseudomonadota bacterium]